MNRKDWEINIENTALRVAEKCGNEVASSVFKRFNATGFEDLSSVYYSEVFADLMFMDEDD